MRFRSAPGSWRILGTGAALPGPPLETHVILERLDQTFGLNITRRGMKVSQMLGVNTRHFCRDFAQVGETPRPGDTNPDIAARALSQALQEAKLDVNDLGYVLTHTTSPHTLLPSNAAWLADRLGYTGPYAELRQACAGFAHGVQLATGLLHAPTDAPIAIVGSETGSVFLDPRQAATDLGQLINFIQMGDGAGAIILSADHSKHGPTLRNAFVGSLGPGLAPGFWLDSGGSGSPSPNGVMQFHHDFAGVRQHGIALFQACIAAALSAGVELDAIHRFLPHQANAHELPKELAGALGVDIKNIVVDCDKVGNLGSASIWVALHRLRASGSLSSDESVLVLGAEATKYLFGGFVYQHA